MLRLVVGGPNPKARIAMGACGVSGTSSEAELHSLQGEAQTNGELL